MKKRDTLAATKIYNYLLDHAGEKHYVSEIARATKVAVSTTWQILERWRHKSPRFS